MGRPPKANLSSEFSALLRQIGANLTFLREGAGLSQAELARRSRISLTTVNEIETRQFRDIRLSTLSAIAKTLSVPVTRLFERSDLDLSSKDQALLLKASEALSRVARKLK